MLLQQAIAKVKPRLKKSFRGGGVGMLSGFLRIQRANLYFRAQISTGTLG